MAPKHVLWDRVWPYCISRGIWGPLWALFWPFWAINDWFKGPEKGTLASLKHISQLYCNPKGLTGTKLCTLGPSITIHFQWEPLGGLWGPFWAMWSDFGTLSMILWPVWSPFTCFVNQKGLSGPKLYTLGQSITILYWWGPLGALGAIFRRFGPFGAHLEDLLELF